MYFLIILFRAILPVAEASNVFTDKFCGILHGGDCSSGAGFIAVMSVRVVNFFSTLIGGAAVIAIVYGAFKIVSSAGNDQGRETGKQVITAAVIGLILALSAEAIVQFVVNFVLDIPGT
ncbi:hypothetical protein COU80_03170 [Candidatus Peregrinibacteria bacterium CG10_big_fil_rev_8_21_14_0_10_55_24]|nr:MAG: hypothetical protein COU80_03170 [Candidatus Peregrinibacteria bacterium CG10_big_fil_rev_8_21_14_0_10_55_24]